MASTDIPLLSLIFFLFALTYSAVGFGGGSSYLALLFFIGMPFQSIPKVALICNLIVVSGGAYGFIKDKLMAWDVLTPLLICSLPAAFFGGQFHISKQWFLVLLSVTLLISGTKLLVKKSLHVSEPCAPSRLVIAVVGSAIGFTSGIIGIGGGILLAPLMHLFHWVETRKVSAIACLFIFFNSLAGLGGQVLKSGVMDLGLYYPLFLSVLIGGLLGNYLCRYKLRGERIIQLTGLLIIFVSFRIFYQLFY